MSTYKKYCLCGEPLEVPIWKRCNDCDKNWRKEAAREYARRKKESDLQKNKVEPVDESPPIEKSNWICDCPEMFVLPYELLECIFCKKRGPKSRLIHGGSLRKKQDMV